MTQAFNLSQFANKVNTSGQADLTTAVTGQLPVANGGTGTSTPSLVAGTGISISGSFPNQTVTSTVTGGVTSLNGQTGAITNTGYGSIGSYVVGWGANSTGYTNGSTIAGSDIAYTSSNSYGAFSHLTAANGSSSPSMPTVMGSSGGGYSFASQGLSGTWRCMTKGGGGGTNYRQWHLWVRIS